MTSEIDLPPAPPPLPEDGRRLTVPDAEFSTPAASSLERVCPNCGAPVHGPFCYACGQSEKGMIRHLTEVLSDLADIVLNVDSRIFRSLWDLYIRPGFLTTEYLAGRRARYVTPFRLFFFLTIVAFFAMQASIDPEDWHFDGDEKIEDASTPEEVQRRVDGRISLFNELEDESELTAKARAKLDLKIAAVRKAGNVRLLEIELEGASTPEDVQKFVDAKISALTAAADDPGSQEKSKDGLEEQIETVRELGETRLLELKEDAAALAAGKPLPDRSKKGEEFTMITLHGEPWHAETNPLVIDFLPEAFNKKLNATLSHMEANIKGAQDNPVRLMVGWFSVLPQTLFVVMPLFAVLLKIFYLFKRRLYMEHLLVALHSHAFIFMSILVILFLTMLAGFAEGSLPLLELIEWLRVAAWIWLFVYLLIMQKRVYRQGWVMTVLKYCVIGLCYTVFLSFSLAVSFLIMLAFT